MGGISLGYNIDLRMFVLGFSLDSSFAMHYPTRELLHSLLVGGTLIRY